MKSRGIDTSQLTDTPPLARKFSDCPGAKLRISQADYDALVKGGERFTSARNAIPVDGLGDARVHCDREVMTKLGCAGYIVEYGLCASCSGLEADNRRMLRERQKARGG